MLLQQEQKMQHNLASNLVNYEISFRIPMPVKENRVYFHTGTYPVCPKCKSSLDREYMSFCDRCGQCLEWQDYGRLIP